MQMMCHTSNNLTTCGAKSEVKYTGTFQKKSEVKDTFQRNLK